MAVELPPVTYPVFVWYDGYAQLVKKPIELCSHSRSMFCGTVERARSRHDHLIAARGRCFDIIDWHRIAKFGGLTAIALWLVGTIFATPVLCNERQLSLPEFKKKIADAMRSRYRYDLDKYPAVDSARKLKAAKSYAEAMDAIQKL